MLKLFHSLFKGSPRETPDEALIPHADPPSELVCDGADPFPFLSHLSNESGFPILDWEVAQSWTNSLPEQGRGGAWTQVERAWLEHMRFALGPSYTLRETEEVFVLSSLEPNIARATLTFVAKTLERIVRVLEGIAEVPEWGKNILIVFDDDETYYRYVSHYYPKDGEFAASGGMFIHAGCGHFATVKTDLRMTEPVIAHELTHSCVSHLPIPAWLNEGLAVSTEQRLCPAPSSLHTPREMHLKHMDFWEPERIQEFWAGTSFLISGDANLLSYDLARILVAQLSGDWHNFRAFVLDANLNDAGASSAAQHLGIDLGALVSAVLECDSAGGFSPDSKAWRTPPSRGAF